MILWVWLYINLWRWFRPTRSACTTRWTTFANVWHLQLFLNACRCCPGVSSFVFFLRLLISFSHRQPSSQKLCAASQALTALPYPSSQCRRNPPWHEKKSREILRQRHHARRHHGWPREERFLRQLVLMLSPQQSTLSKEHKIDGCRKGEAHSCFYLFSFIYFSLLSWRWRNGRAVSPSCSRSERWSSFDSLGVFKICLMAVRVFHSSDPPILLFFFSLSLSLSFFFFSFVWFSLQLLIDKL